MGLITERIDQAIIIHDKASRQIGLKINISNTQFIINLVLSKNIPWGNN